MHQPSTCNILTSSSTIYLEWQYERVSFTPSSQSALPAEVNPCQSAVSLSPAESCETRLISYFTQTHLGVIDFSFSECEMDSLSFIPERRRSWQTVARSLMEASVKCNLSQDPSVICFTLNWIAAFCLRAHQRLFNSPMSLHQNANEFNPITIIFWCWALVDAVISSPSFPLRLRTWQRYDGGANHCLR